MKYKHMSCLLCQFNHSQKNGQGGQGAGMNLSPLKWTAEE